MPETETAPVARRRAAVEVLRRWVAEAPPQPWAPGAVAAFGPELARWLDAVAVRLTHSTHPDWQETVEAHAFATADAILAADTR